MNSIIIEMKDGSEIKGQEISRDNQGIVVALDAPHAGHTVYVLHNYIGAEKS